MMIVTFWIDNIREKTLLGHGYTRCTLWVTPDCNMKHGASLSIQLYFEFQCARNTLRKIDMIQRLTRSCKSCFTFIPPWTNSRDSKR